MMSIISHVEAVVKLTDCSDGTSAGEIFCNFIT